MSRLYMIFGVAHSVCTMFILFTRRALVKVLTKDALATIKILTATEVEALSSSINIHYYLLKAFYAAAGESKLILQESGYPIIQEVFDNWWTHDHYIENVSNFAPSSVPSMIAKSSRKYARPIRC